MEMQASHEGVSEPEMYNHSKNALSGREFHIRPKTYNFLCPASVQSETTVWVNWIRSSFARQADNI